ncbi:dolichyl-phosphate-mannose--protein mannosyltransferase [Actinopolyspora lacussalsi]|uniref:dolichyl-phosphate-mannose--protein mannosyltransferase n=1 Tax=Actinopolyspora righensis TaxID=995060 RepID=UPI001C31DE96|nr:phospholipid carrier-dependent glycosyltransferase [Actinopolyspora righensis]
MNVLVPSSGGSSARDEAVRDGETPPARYPGEHDRAKLLSPREPTDRLRGWIVTLVVTLLAGVVRFWRLGQATDDGTPIFDEKHYVPQAWQMLRNGGFEDNPGYELVAHPPVGKHLIAVGEWLFGYTPLGWRFSAAVAGTLMVLLLVRVARRMTRSTLLGALAGILLICDGLSHVQARVGMLDIFHAVLVLAAFACLLVDRDRMRSRLALVVTEQRIGESELGPRLGFRWWRFGAGILLGMACGVKWSGIYFVLALSLLSLVWDALARRSAGVARPWRGASLRDALPTFASLFVLPLVVYFATWAAWYASETATDRHAAAVADDVGFGFLPDMARSLLYYHFNVLEFHTHLVTGDDPHPWESKPWAWPMGMRPMLYYYESGMPGCGQGDCVQATMLLGTPALWWVALPVAGWAVWRAVGRLDWRYAAVLVCYCAGYLPWFVNLDRQMYYFYATPLAPFLVLGIVLVLGEILGRSNASTERRKTGLLVVALYVGLVVANFVWLWPILNGFPITEARWAAELWLPSWR